MVFCFILFFLYLEKIKGFNISIEIINEDDCIYNINLDNTTVLYQKETYDTHCNTREHYIEGINYDIGQKLNIEVIDTGGQCFLIASVRVILNNYNYAIYTNDKKFWKCKNCEGDSLNQEEEKTKFLCYPARAYIISVSNLRLIYYYFQINSILDLPDISEYYYFNENNYIPKHTSNLNGKIDLIDLNSIGNLYAKNNKNNEKIAILYNDIYYKLFFYQYYYYRGKFYGFNESNNYIILNENIYSKIYSNKPLRYELSEEERKNNGA